MAEVGVIITANDKASAVFKKIGGAAKNSLKSLPDQLGKASTAMLLLQSSTSQMSGKMADAGNKIFAVAGLIATGGPLGIAIAGATAAMFAYSEITEITGAETRALEDATASLGVTLSVYKGEVKFAEAQLASLTAELDAFGLSAKEARKQVLLNATATRESGIPGLEEDIKKLIAQNKILSNDYVIGSVRVGKAMQTYEALRDGTKEQIAANNLQITGFQKTLAELKKKQEAEKESIVTIEELQKKEEDRLDMSEKRIAQIRRVAKAKRKAETEALRLAREAAAEEKKLAAEKESRQINLIRNRQAREKFANDQAIERTKRREALLIGEAQRVDAARADFAAEEKTRQEQAAEETRAIASAAVSLVSDSITILADSSVDSVEKIKAIGLGVLGVAKGILQQVIIAEIVASITKKAIKKKEAVSGITANAGLAAAGAAAAVAPTPFIGPALAPVAAAETFASTIGWIAPAIAPFATGGILSGSGPTDSALARITPGKERVLSERQTAAFEKFVGQMGDGGTRGQAPITVAPTFQNLTPPSSMAERRNLVLSLASEFEWAVRSGLINLQPA